MQYTDTNDPDILRAQCQAWQANGGNNDCFISTSTDDDAWAGYCANCVGSNQYRWPRRPPKRMDPVKMCSNGCVDEGMDCIDHPSFANNRDGIQRMADTCADSSTLACVPLVSDMGDFFEPACCADTPCEHGPPTRCSQECANAFVPFMEQCGTPQSLGAIYSDLTSFNEICKRIYNPPAPPAPPPPRVNCAGRWGDWDVCSADCGGGIQWRSYIVTKEAANGGTLCSVDEPRSCNTQTCDVDCAGSWGAWSSTCSNCELTMNLGTGKMQANDGSQSRTFTVTTPAAYNGAACPVPQSRSCSNCPVNCAGSWSNWGACSDCRRGGTMSRSYGVTTPPLNGGSTCPVWPGSSETQPCTTESCNNVRPGGGQH